MRPTHLLVALLLSSLACSEPREHPGPLELPGKPEDPLRVEALALEAVAASAEADATEGGAQLTALADALEQRLTPADEQILAHNYLMLLETARDGTRWGPDPKVRRILEGLRDLPLLDGLPAPKETVPKRGSLPRPQQVGGAFGVQPSALVLANVQPSCALACPAQGVTYALLDYGAGTVQKYYLDLLTSGVDCAQDAAKLGRCVAADNCGRGDFMLFLGGCASLSANVALEVVGARKAAAAYAFLKQALALWSAGALASGFADWMNRCYDFQQTSCPPAGCAEAERLCRASTGAGEACCPFAASCADCTLCPIPCGFEGCCATGQRCVDGQCQRCASGCGATCCGEREVCANPEQGLCAPCDNPCGTACCPTQSTCMIATRTCCDAPCGDTCCGPGEQCDPASGTCCATPCDEKCCGPGEACHPTIGECCATVCGDDCCAPGQLCDPAASRCSDPGGCDDAPSIDCAQLCNQAIKSARQRCSGMGGTLENVDAAGCVGDCMCIIAEVPNLMGCELNPSCPGCDRLQEVVGRCGQHQAICRVPQGG